MPHFTIEYSNTVETLVTPSNLLSSVNQGAINSGLFDPSAIKIRCASFEDTWVGGKETGTFLHVKARILSGRTVEQKNKLSSSVYDQLLELGLSLDALTVEICDIDRTSHQPSPD